jgi:hypothetical protein
MGSNPIALTNKTFAVDGMPSGRSCGGIRREP